MEFVEYKIGQLAKSIHTGKTPPSQMKEYFKEEINWITPSDMDGRKTITNTIRKVSKSALNDKYVFLHQKNTIVIGTKGDIGKVCIVDFPSASNDQTTGVFLDSELILPELFYYWVKLNKGMLEFKANKAIISILSNKHLRKVKITFPKNITDQQKIVSELNQLQDVIDLKVKTIEIIETLKKNYFLEYFLENPLSEKWDYISIDATNAVKSTKYGLTEKPNSDIDGYPVVRMNNITYNGDIDLTNLKYVTITKSEFESSQIKIEKYSLIEQIAQIL